MIVLARHPFNSRIRYIYTVELFSLPDNGGRRVLRTCATHTCMMAFHAMYRGLMQSCTAHIPISLSIIGARRWLPNLCISHADYKYISSCRISIMHDRRSPCAVDHNNAPRNAMRPDILYTLMHFSDPIPRVTTSHNALLHRKKTL